MTMSIDGFLKFWKKTFHLIEAVRQFKAHKGMEAVQTSGVINSAALSLNHTRLATCSSSDDSVKLFDIRNCDLITTIKLNYSPVAIQYILKKESENELLAM